MRFLAYSLWKGIGMGSWKAVDTDYCGEDSALTGAQLVS